MKYFTLLITLFVGFDMPAFTQDAEVLSSIINQYSSYQEMSIKDRRFKHSDIVPLIEAVKADKRFELKEAGKSIEGRPIYLVRIGTGATKVFLWSQMHGNESTATMAIFDLFNFFKAEDAHTAWKEDLLAKVSLYFMPMLNPDGAERFTRRNYLGVDLNRDALRLQSPEARILKETRDELAADFGFNLHDQGRVYAAGRSDEPATISFLAPAYNYEKEVNEVRGNAMKVIALMNRSLQQYIPGRVAKYDDDFEPRAFGDNIQKWGTSAILIESGGARNDREKQSIRKVNFIAILTGLHAIANKLYEDEKVEDYENIPFNERLLFDLMVRNANIDLLGKLYKVDIAINQYEVDSEDHRGFRLVGRVAEWGDLSIFHGYKEIDAEGMQAIPSKVYPQVVKNTKALAQLNPEELFLEGYTHIRLKKIPKDTLIDTPFTLLDKKGTLPSGLSLGSRANFVLKKGNEVKYVVLNGGLVWPRQ